MSNKLSDLNMASVFVSAYQIPLTYLTSGNTSEVTKEKYHKLKCESPMSIAASRTRKLTWIISWAALISAKLIPAMCSFSI